MGTSILCLSTDAGLHFPSAEHEDSVEIEIYPRLAVGDVVLLFAFNNFQRWYVAERLYSPHEA